ncbi:MAG: S41 family peptidase, partial [candidate division Zixibacteria bacterium]|nr:S41 family peptidase [candidate division Zixibacteria bacterium]
KLGLRAGDLIVKIEGESTYKMSTADASKMMRGKAGTTVIISIKREGMPDVLEFEIERAQISLNSVNYSGKVPGTNIGYIRLSRFAQTSRTELDDALRKLNPICSE